MRAFKIRGYVYAFEKHGDGDFTDISAVFQLLTKSTALYMRDI